jgi:hypothetical protein
MTPRTSAIAFVAALVLGASGLVHAAVAQRAPTTAALDQPFKLNAGRSAIIDGERLQIGFERVVSDSRCPQDAQCITAGEAIVRVWLVKAPDRREARDLNTTPDAAGGVYGAYRVTLVALDPLPTTDRAVRPSEYVATLIVSRPRQ